MGHDNLRRDDISKEMNRRDAIQSLCSMLPQEEAGGKMWTKACSPSFV